MFGITAQRAYSSIWTRQLRNGSCAEFSRYRQTSDPVIVLKQVRRGVSATPELTHQRVKGRRRFYKKVTTREVPRDEGGAQESSKRWEILLDGRVLKTPARQPLQV